MKFNEAQLESAIKDEPREPKDSNAECSVMNDELPETPAGEFLLYTTEDGQSRVECRFENKTLWLSQALMAELFETTPQNITLHLKALYEDEEIDEIATCKDYLQVRQGGTREVRRSLKHCNLEAIDPPDGTTGRQPQEALEGSPQGAKSPCYFFTKRPFNL